MVSRRAMVGAGTVGGLLAMAAPVFPEASSAAPAADISERALDGVALAVKAVRDELNHQASFWEIAVVREPIRTFLRTNGKFPDYIDVGTDIWQQVYDWHVRFRQPITLGRTPDGRYTIALIATTVIMRTDTTPNHVGIPYDSQ